MLIRNLLFTLSNSANKNSSPFDTRAARQTPPVSVREYQPEVLILRRGRIPQLDYLKEHLAETFCNHSLLLA